MNKIILTGLLIIVLHFAKSQNVINSISYISPKKDTLMLPNNNLGIEIKNIWNTNPKPNPPIILLVSEDKIREKNKNK